MSTSPSTTDSFFAIGDANRRAILDLLRHGERSVQDITAELSVTISAVSQHLKVLREAQLVSERREGRYKLYRSNPAMLGNVADWVMEHYEEFWRAKHDALGTVLDEVEAEERGRKKN